MAAATRNSECCVGQGNSRALAASIQTQHLEACADPAGTLTIRHIGGAGLDSLVTRAGPL